MICHPPTQVTKRVQLARLAIQGLCSVGLQTHTEDFDATLKEASSKRDYITHNCIITSVTLIISPLPDLAECTRANKDEDSE